MVLASQLVGRVAIEGDDSARSKLSMVGRAVDQAQQAMTSKLTSATKSAGAGFLDFASKAGMAIIGFKELANAAINAGLALLRPHAELENFTASFKTFLKSDAAAKTMMQDIQKLADTIAPFESSKLAAGASNLLAMKVQAGDVVPLMTAIGNAVAGLNLESHQLGDIARLFGEINSTGYVTGEVLGQIRDRGIDAYGMLREKLGLTQDQLEKQLASHEILASDALPALRDGFNQAFPDAMLNKSKTLDGRVSTIIDGFKKLYIETTKPIFAKVSEGAGKLVDVLSNPALIGFATGIGVLIGNVMENTGKIVGGSVVPGFQLLAEKMSPVGQIVQNLASRVRPFIDRVGAWADRNDILEKSLSALESVLNLARNAFNAAEGALGPIIDAVVDWTAKNDPLAIALDVVKNAVNFAKTAIDNAKQAIENIVKWYKDWEPVILSVSGAITAFFLPAIIKAGVKAVISASLITANFIASMAATGAEATVSGAKLTVSFIASMVRSGVEAVVNAAKITASFVASLVRAGVEGWASAIKLAIFVGLLIASGVQAAIAGAIVAGQFVLSLVRTGVQAAITGGILLASLVPGIVAVIAQSAIAAAVAIPGLIVGFVGWAIAAGGAAIATIAATWPILAIVAIIALVVAGIILAVTHWGEIMHWIQEVAKSVWAGIQSAWSGAIGFFKGVGDGIWNGIKWGLNMAIEGINTLIGFLNGLHIGIPAFEIAGVKTPAAEIRLPHIPSIPKLARGGLIGEEGFADVHRDERIYLPRGARVVPASQAQQMREAPAQGPITVILQVDRYQLGKVIMPLVSENVRLSTGVRI